LKNTVFTKPFGSLNCKTMDYLTQALGLIKLRPLDVKNNKPPFIIGDMPARIIGNQLFLDLMTFLSGFCL